MGRKNKCFQMIKIKKTKGLKRSLFHSSRQILEKWKLYNRTEFACKSVLHDITVSLKEIKFCKDFVGKKDLGYS